MRWLSLERLIDLAQDFRQDKLLGLNIIVVVSLGTAPGEGKDIQSVRELTAVRARSAHAHFSTTSGRT